MIGIRLAYYRKRDWKRFLKIIDDRESMHDTWAEWHKDFLKVKNELTAKELEIVVVEIDLDELTNYCKLRKIKNDGKARSQFVQAK